MRVNDTQYRVLYLCSFVDPTIDSKFGGGRYSPAGYKKKVGFIRALRSVGVDTILVSPVNANIFPPRYFRGFQYPVKDLGMTIYYPSVVGLFHLNELFLVFSTIYTIVKLKKRFDAILFYNYHLYTTLPALFCKLVYRTPIILEYEDGLFGVRNLWTAWAARLLEWAFGKFLDGAILNTLNFRERIQTENYCVVRGFIEQEEITARTNWVCKDSKKIRIMFAGRLDRIRGIDAFLEVCRKLSAMGHDMEFWVTGYGKGGFVAKVKLQLEELLGDRCRFWGFVPREKYKELLHQADVLVNLQKPSYVFSRYCFPSKLIEFMASGNVVVSTEISDLNQFARDMVVLCKEDPNDVARKINEVVKNFQHYREYGQRCQAWVLAHCTLEANGKRVLELLKRILRDEHEKSM